MKRLLLGLVRSKPRVSTGFQPETIAFLTPKVVKQLTPKSPQICTIFSKSGTSPEPVGKICAPLQKAGFRPFFGRFLVHFWPFPTGGRIFPTGSRLVPDWFPTGSRFAKSGAEICHLTSGVRFWPNFEDALISVNARMDNLLEKGKCLEGNPLGKGNDFTPSMLLRQLHGNPQEVSSKFPNPKKWILSIKFSPNNCFLTPKK